MGLNRRAFLQQAALVAALGLGDAGFAVASDRYQQALAQPTRRKLALLRWHQPISRTGRRF